MKINNTCGCKIQIDYEKTANREITAPEKYVIYGNIIHCVRHSEGNVTQLEDSLCNVMEIINRMGNEGKKQSLFLEIVLEAEMKIKINQLELIKQGLRVQYNVDNKKYKMNVIPIEDVGNMVRLYLGDTEMVVRMKTQIEKGKEVG